MRHLTICAVGLVALGSAAGAATTDTLVFGDSLSDPFVPGLDTPRNQYTDGDTWAVQIGATSPETGNFARAGATALSDGNTATDRDFDGQLHVFAESGLQTGRDPVALVWFGGNDAAAATQLAAPLAATGAGEDVISEALAARIAPAVTDLGDGLVELIDAGVTDIVVVTAPDIGATPLISGLGLSDLGSRASALFNQGLRDMVADVSGSANIGILDSDQVISPALSNPSAYGLTNVADACVRGDALESAEICEGFAFYNPFHPTETIHDLFAEAAEEAAADVAAVPLPATAPLLLAGLGGVAALRRHRRSGG